MSRDVRILVNCWVGNLKRVDEFVRAAGELGVDGVELSLDYPLTLDSPESRRLTRLLRDYDLLLAIHLPWREVHLASPLKDIRVASLNTIKRSLTGSERLTIEYLVTHLSTNQAFCGPKDRECLKAAEESLAKVAELAEELGTKVLVETVYDRCCSNEDKLPALLEALNLDNVGVCVDLPHILERRHRLWGANLGGVGGTLEEAPPVLLEKALGAHVHGVKRVRGQVLTHVMPSRRFLTLLIREYFENLRGLKYVTVEVFRDGSGRTIKDLSTLCWVIEKLRGASGGERPVSDRH